MERQTSERHRDVVLVGGGHSHVQVLRSLASRPLPRCRLTVVVDRPMAVYSGMVPGYVAGQYRRRQLEIDVAALAGAAGARLVTAAACRVDPTGRRILLEQQQPVRYDLASFNIGSTVAGLDLPGVGEHSISTRPIHELVRQVGALVEAAARPGQRVLRVVVVGGGAGGVELAFTLEARLGEVASGRVEVELVHGGAELMGGYPQSLRRRLHRRAEQRGITVRTRQHVVAAEPDRALLRKGGEIPCEVLIWVTGAIGHPLFRESGLPTDGRGFVPVRNTLQVVGHDDLFAAGDCATLSDHPGTPKAGVYAVRQGPVLTDNLRARLEGGELREYRPQRDFLTLLNLGDGTALGAKWGLAFEGRWVMRLKDHIDRRFMARFQIPDRASTGGREIQSPRS